jgi:hypothetical protein
VRPRIRTIKPEFFVHEGLFDLEQESGLPVRLAFAGLWCVADREGRFVWRPRTLKVAIMPHDVIDFGAVLDALERAGFVTRYEVERVEYGLVTTFKTHQVINQREAASAIPPPPAQKCTDAHVHLEATHVHARGEGKGREGNGRGGARVHAIPVRGGSGTATAPAAAAEGSSNGTAEKVSSEHVARAWAKALGQPGGNPGAMHAHDSWRSAFSTIAAACNAVDGKPVVALVAVVEWFWLAPDGPVQMGRIARVRANPGQLAKHVSRDLDAAQVWWLQRREAERAAHHHEAAQ